RVLAGMPPEAAALIPWEEEDGETLKDFLRRSLPKEEVYVFIGPEGGFDPGEVDKARAVGVRPVTLGPRILRTETAGLAVLVMVLYQWGDLGGNG
ncbi:MAG: RNA methyltransferase, partial [Firmicutes bacterium]|nr:RNA methyltransferase [Bacillota bacterium]